MRYELKHISDFIFKDKKKYDNLTDEDKERLFFILNRKFARVFPKHAQYFNRKGIDKASAMDVWYYFFIKQRTTDIPDWYLFRTATRKRKRQISKLKDDEVKFITKQYNISERDLAYLLENFPEEVDEAVRKYKKFRK